LKVRLPPSRGLWQDVTLTFVAVTERARKLRSNYNIHAQTLRTRVEIRVHRISRPLRNITMGDLLHKYSSQQQQKDSARGPPVPEKDRLLAGQAFRRPLTTIPGSPVRQAKRARFVSFRHSYSGAVLILSCTVMRFLGGTRKMRLRALICPRRRHAPGQQRRTLREILHRSCHQPRPTRV